MSVATFAWLVAWGTLVGLDLVSVAQVMIARPLVAGTVAGAILGDLTAGAMVGAILELFALDLLPVGATRYPDYGTAAVAGAAVAAGAPGVLGIGLAVTLGLALAYAGQWGIHAVRRGNARDIERHRAGLDAGDARIIRRLHLTGILRDVVRALIATALGLLLALLLRRFPLVTLRGAVLLAAVALGAGLAVAVTGALKLTRGGAARAWFLGGLAAGAGWVLWR